jgi:hypothetical protein
MLRITLEEPRVLDKPRAGISLYYLPLLAIQAEGLPCQCFTVNITLRCL